MIIRSQRPESGWTLVRNDVLQDARLSFRAVGVLVDVLSRPDDWRTSAEALSKEGPGREGRVAVEKALKELETAGYVVRRKLRRSNGTYSWDHIVYDSPQSQQVITAGHTTRQESTYGETGHPDVSAGRTTHQESVSGKPVPGFPLTDNQGLETCALTKDCDKGLSKQASNARARENPPEITRLAAALNDAGLTGPSWSGLGDLGTAKITALVRLHGTAPLVAVARNASRTSTGGPPRYVGAWIPDWEALPTPATQPSTTTTPRGPTPEPPAPTKTWKPGELRALVDNHRTTAA